MKLDELIGKLAVRTKALARMEYEHDGGLSYGGRYVSVPDNRWCTRPVLIKAIEKGVVYIEWRGDVSDKIYKEILDPKFVDEHWAPVNEDYLK